MKQITTNLLGGLSPEQFLTLTIFAFIGVLVSLLIHATNRSVESSRSPVKFSFFFLLKDNVYRIVLNLLLILLTIRFCKDLTGFELTHFVAFLIGVSYDKLAELLRNVNWIDKKSSNG